MLFTLLILPAAMHLGLAQDALDADIETNNNCECVFYTECSYANGFELEPRFGIEINCTNPDRRCCKTTYSNVTLKSLERSSEILSSCGISRTKVDVRILNPDIPSAATVPGEFPWIVEIFQKPRYKQNPAVFKCAGSLIHPRVVLTAPHCVASNVGKEHRLKIVATGKNTFQTLGTNPKDERNVIKIIKHPKFNSGGLYNDVALVILDQGYLFKDTFLNSACLPPATKSFVGRKCMAVGWGDHPEMDTNLHKVDVPIVDFQTCQSALRSARGQPDWTLHSSFVCAGGEEGKDTCKGDGGGPLMCTGESFEFLLVGLVSWGHNEECGVERLPGVYANVGNFVEWIEEELKKENINT